MSDDDMPDYQPYRVTGNFVCSLRSGVHLENDSLPFDPERGLLFYFQAHAENVNTVLFLTSFLSQ